MPGDTGGVRHQTADGEGPLSLLGPPPDGVPGGIPSLTQNFKHGDGFSDNTLGAASCGRGGRAGRFRTGSPVAHIFFYTNKRILTSPRQARLQAALDVLTVLFDRVGLRTNVTKTMWMVCQTCCCCFLLLMKFMSITRHEVPLVYIKRTNCFHTISGVSNSKYAIHETYANQFVS